MGYFEITKREILVSIAIFFLMIGIGFLISQNIESKVEEENEVYHKALKIEDIDTYNYAKDTNIGNCFTFFTLDADTPQTIPELTGEYLYIERVYEEEHYKSRTVTETYTDSKGKTQTRTRIEHYWEWDVESRDRYQSPTCTFNGESFSTDRFSGINDHRLELDESTVTSDYLDQLGWSASYLKKGSHKRWSFYVVPLHLEGATYVNLADGTVQSKKIPLKVNSSVQSVYESYLSSATFGTVMFWILWIMLTGGLIFGYCYLDNNYLEDDNGKSKKSNWRYWS